MNDHEKMQYIQYMQMKDELENAVYAGVGLKIDGCDTSPHHIATACVFQEDFDYMRDYRRDDSGRISSLCFDRIHNVRHLDD